MESADEQKVSSSDCDPLVKRRRFLRFSGVQSSLFRVAEFDLRVAVLS